MLFSAKESVYKAWFPMTGRPLGFEDAQISFDPDDGTFSARLLVPGWRLGDAELTVFQGRWAVRAGLVLTAVAVPVAQTVHAVHGERAGAAPGATATAAP